VLKWPRYYGITFDNMPFYRYRVSFGMVSFDKLVLKSIKFTLGDHFHTSIKVFKFVQTRFSNIWTIVFDMSLVHYFFLIIIVR
jgi:hypothetical protein